MHGPPRRWRCCAFESRCYPRCLPKTDRLRLGGSSKRSTIDLTKMIAVMAVTEDQKKQRKSGPQASQAACERRRRHQRRAVGVLRQWRFHGGVLIESSASCDVQHGASSGPKPTTFGQSLSENRSRLSPHARMQGGGGCKVTTGAP